MKTVLQSLRVFAVLTVLTGLAYPLLITAVAHVAFPVQAGGSLVRRHGRVVGSALLAQRTDAARYFWPRPSATDYATVPAGASNLGPTSRALRDAVATRAAALRAANHLAPGQPLPADLLFASGSGLDPDISPAAAMLQVPRVAAARHLPPAAVIALVERRLQPGDLLGEDRVNVLRLNLALDAGAAPKP